MRLSLDDGGDRNYWAAFGDIALATLLVFILGVISQFHKVIIWQIIEGHQQEVAQLIEGELPDAFRQSVQIRRIDSQHQKVTFSSDALFPECKVDLTARGDSILQIVGQILADRIEYFQQIQIEGHTDIQPPAGPPSCPVEDNWELSSQRATRVVRLLSAESLLPPELLSSIGRGEHHPATAVGNFAENRRIELVLQYRETDLLPARGAS